MSVDDFYGQWLNKNEKYSSLMFSFVLLHDQSEI